MSEPSAGAKVCSKCGQDVSGKPRSKDAQGRYVCAECAKAKAPAKAAKTAGGEFEDNSFLLNVGKGELSFEECPGCQRPVRAGSKLCTMCGYNIAEGRALKTRVSVEKEPKAAGGAKQPMSVGQKFFIVGMVPTLLGVGGYFVSTDVPALMLAYIIYAVMWFVVWIWGTVAGFKENILHGLLMLVTFGMWGLYFIFFKQEDGRLKGLFGAYLLGGTITGIVAAMAAAKPGGSGLSSVIRPDQPPALVWVDTTA